MTTRRSHDWVRRVDEELSQWPDVDHFRKTDGKHFRLYLTFGDKTRFIVYPSSPRKCPRSLLNHISLVKRTLTEMGAKKVLDQ